MPVKDARAADDEGATREPGGEEWQHKTLNPIPLTVVQAERRAADTAQVPGSLSPKPFFQG